MRTLLVTSGLLALQCTAPTHAVDAGTSNIAAQCENIEYAGPWADSLGYTCADYASEDLCTPDGKPSATFVDLYGEDWSLEDFSFVDSAAKVYKHAIMQTYKVQ